MDVIADDTVDGQNMAGSSCAAAASACSEALKTAHG